MRVFTLIALLLASGCGSGDDAAGSGGSVEWTGERGPLRMTVRVTPKAVSAGDRLTLVLEVEAPAGYSELNEAERDSLYQRSAVSFALTHPVTLIRLTIVKGFQFLRGWSGPDPLIALLFPLGGFFRAALPC